MMKLLLWLLKPLANIPNPMNNIWEDDLFVEVLVEEGYLHDREKSHPKKTS